MKLELGCGDRKHPGFFGIDSRPLEGVDLVHDLNTGIPLPDNSVEWVMASRCLPYIHDLSALMNEIHRVCIHKAVLCILAPYAHSFRHISNPLLKHKFDEHTPRYLTQHFFQPSHTTINSPLSHYAGTESGQIIPFDFRLLRMELFYAETFRSPLYEPEELEMLLQLQANVVDEIMYHFVAVKESIAESELEQLSRQTFLEPACAGELRLDHSPSWEDAHEPLEEWKIASPLAPETALAGHRYGKKKPRLLRNRKKRSRYSH
ncbi:MAG: hypothetical protein K0R57_6018 [Paenibacillaceae bacterium]|jgi:SAM-dependent methyltransferase|nr:hypothetical protein [Paenibacillaceae bacterium]